MEIKTKFGVNELVYTLIDNEVKYTQILYINIAVAAGRTSITYSVLGGHSFIDENKLFSTKEELLKSL